MIEVRGLTKRYGAKIAVDDLTFGIEPGKVTGFLGGKGSKPMPISEAEATRIMHQVKEGVERPRPSPVL